MTNQPVLLGVPISMALRGINTASSFGTMGKVTTVATGIAAVSAIAPWLETTTSAEASEETPSLPEQAINAAVPFAMGALSFIDMNARMIGIKQKRRIGVSSIPSRTGDWIQDLGSHSARYNITGSFYDTDPHYLSTKGLMTTIMKTYIGSAAVGNVHLLNLIMNTGAKIPIVSKHEITFGMITDFDYTEMGGEPLEVKYDIKLIEVGGIPLIGKTVLLAARNLASDVTSSLLSSR